ncbi:fibronectin type III domain-containing protein [Dehalococcoides mccartyi]|uniref:Fibronectin type III domain-containing protein n=1 Tax=Dehalococcoides mccartyi TaxID=61435 RepID=A0AB38ZBY1_9CHLR|nr:fibronectin type III domain-containing protein [Dehalococcoides mccartyi]WRO08098.1 fibronectin type III domain-containing protein [Dehalococcoides mccartyi]
MFKTKISKVLGVVLTAAMVLSMFTVATPVAAANQAWSKIALPGSGATGGYVVSTPGTRVDNIGILEWNADKTAVYATAQYDGSAAIFKSTDAGRTWKMLTIPTVTGGIIYDFVASSVNANELYFTDGREIFTSKDGGATWNNLSNVFTWAVANTWTTPPVSGTNLIVTLDIGYAGANKYVFAGTAQFGTVGTGNGVFMCQETAFGMPWSDLAIDTQRPAGSAWNSGCSVWDVVVDPTDFAVKQGVIAVATYNDGVHPVQTVITAKYFGNQWNQTATCDDTQVLVNNTTAITSVVHAELWLPSDFNSSLTSGKFQAWLALQTTGSQGDVYLWYGSANGLTTPKTIDLNVSGLSSQTEITDIDGVGGIADAKLIIGGYSNAAVSTPKVWYSSDRLTFSGNSKRPTGAASTWGLPVATVTVLAMGDYNTSGKALAGTAGYDCGVSYTADFGKTWNTISLMRQAIVSVENIAGSLFVVTNDWAQQSVWRIVNGVTERVFSSTLIGGPFNQLDVQVSPAGDAVFIADIGIGGTATIWRSLDNGQTFAAQVSNISTAGGSIINSWLVSNANTILVGGTNNVYQTSTNGVLWFARACLVGTVTSFAVSTDGSVLVAAGSLGKISKSTDGGVTWSTASAAAPTVSAVSLVTFQNGSNSVVYLTGNSGGVFKYDFAATTPAWSALGATAPVQAFDNDAASAVVNGVGIFSGIASGGNVLYVLDGNVAADPAATPPVVADGLSRFTMVGTTSYAGSVATPGTAVGTKLIGIAAPGANMLYGIFGAELYVYTDKMAVPVANVQITKITTTSLTVTWDALNVDNSNIEVMYYVYITDAATGAKVAYMTTSAFTSDGTTVGTSFKINDLDVDTVYQVSVWAVDPVMSFVGTASVSTQPDRPDYTVNLMPTNGASNVPVNPVFAWDAVSTAVSYDLVLSTDPTFADATKVLATKNLTTNYWAYDGTLSNSASYYWRVRVNTANSTSEWFPAVFTTVKADAAPVEVNNPPDITLEVPQAETPAYIWLIVAVGAVLTIAVIVLIVRTRRVV